LQKLPTCCGLVEDLLATRQTILTYHHKSATSWLQVIIIEFGKRHDTTDKMDFCTRQLVRDLLQTCCGHDNRKL